MGRAGLNAVFAILCAAMGGAIVASALRRDRRARTDADSGDGGFFLFGGDSGGGDRGSCDGGGDGGGCGGGD